MSARDNAGAAMSMTHGTRLFASSATHRLLGQDGPFHVEGGEMWIENLSCREIVKPLGTPLLVYSSARLRDNIAEVAAAADASSWPIRIHFALKAAYLVGVVALLQEAGLNVEVMSEYEYLLARRIGFSPTQVVVNGPAKRPEFLERAVIDGVSLINVESPAEIAFLQNLGQRLGRTIEVGIRINPLLSRRLRGSFAHPGSKFGFDVPSGEAAGAVRKIISSRSLSLRAVHCHSYTRQYSPDAHRDPDSGRAYPLIDRHRRHSLRGAGDLDGGAYQRRRHSPHRNTAHSRARRAYDSPDAERPLRVCAHPCRAHSKPLHSLANPA